MKLQTNKPTHTSLSHKEFSSICDTSDPSLKKNLDKQLSTFSYYTLPLVSSKQQIIISDSKSIENFDDFLYNCSELQNQVTKASQSIETKFIDHTLTKNFYKENKKAIRNDKYFKGVEKIEEKVLQKSIGKATETKRIVKNAIELSKVSDLHKLLSPENARSQKATEFLSKNKRGFGSLAVISNKKRGKYKVKNTQIKINFDKNNLESLRLLDHANDWKNKEKLMYRNKSNCFKEFAGDKEVLEDMKKNRLIVKLGNVNQISNLNLATMVANRAKLEANRLFTSSKRIKRFACKSQ
ncbi:hypothetical protein SteCoe_36891 [Stentor coeruleus]|uniref:Uncharacterized protein n=1 Tax=Stentor coeruleus TaxID=5963 RepID=A0A1R2AP80_9CILI|nr:hypothetical protein SteCoe_36891 [Stentor coeruleus]